MGFGVLVTKVMLIALQLLVAVVIVGSFATLATGDFDMDVGEPELTLPDAPEGLDDVDDLLENGVNISLSVPIELTIGGYWPITDFQYSFELRAANWDHIGGLEPIDIEPGKSTDLSLLEEINYSPGEDDIYDLIFLGTEFSFSMNISMGYLDNMFKFNTEVSAALTVGPFLDLDLLDVENVTYDGNNLSIPIKTDDIIDEINNLLQDLIDSFDTDLDLGDIDLEDFDLNELLSLLPEGVSVPGFGASFTDDEGNELWTGDASLKVKDGKIILDIEGLTPEELDALASQDGVTLKVNVDLSIVEDFGEDVPDEVQDILDVLDGLLLIKSPADDILDKGQESYGGA